MKILPPFPITTPFLEPDESPQAPSYTSGGAVRRPTPTSSPMARLTQPIKRWMQQVQQIAVPEFASEVPAGAVDGVNRTFTLITAAPDPQTNNLQFFVGPNFQPPNLYSLTGKTVRFFIAPTGGSPYVTYRY